MGLAAPASGQTAINVSFGHTSGAPSATYAAAGGAGMWNAVTGVAGSDYDLVDADGTSTGVKVSQSPTTTMITTGDPTVTGDDGALLNTGLLTTGAETCLSFSHVDPGTYEVLIYAWTPNAPSVLSRTRQDEAPTTIDIGGAWPGAQTEGVTYARYMVTVASDGVLPAHSGLAPGQPSAALNGVQIRPLGVDTGADAGVPPDSGGNPGNGNGPAGGGVDMQPGGHGGGCQSGPGAGIGVAFALGAMLVRRRRATS